MWRCEKCTGENHYENSECVYCGAPKGRSHGRDDATGYGMGRDRGDTTKSFGSELSGYDNRRDRNDLDLGMGGSRSEKDLYKNDRDRRETGIRDRDGLFDDKRGGTSHHNKSVHKLDSLHGYSRDVANLPPQRDIAVTIKRISTTVKSNFGSLEVGIGDKIMRFKISNRDNVYDLKMKIYAHPEGIGWAPKNQKLIFEKEELIDEMIIDNIRPVLKDNDTISLMRRNEYFREGGYTSDACNCCVS
mmetsp:Transcript_83026/g.130596  ORF Transcript_83026/g.130596 Transcript_83026/m.130596 type:complete len:245 (+) Transcript_83026:77-811(+)